MSRKYKFRDNERLYFVTFTVTGWIDVFTRNVYKNIFLDAIRYCQANKDLFVCSWVIMTNHAHLIVGSNGNSLSNIMRDLKRHSAERLHEAIRFNKSESRREWMLMLMNNAVKRTGKKSDFQLWQQESHPVVWPYGQILHKKLNYIHNNPVKAGYVIKPGDWLYSSAIDYDGGKGLIDIVYIEPRVLII